MELIEIDKAEFNPCLVPILFIMQIISLKIGNINLVCSQLYVYQKKVLILCGFI